MICFPDTSFLCSLYRLQADTAIAVEWNALLPEALPVTSLLLLEFRQSVRFQNRLFNLDRNKGFPPKEGARKA